MGGGWWVVGKVGGAMWPVGVASGRGQDGRGWTQIRLGGVSIVSMILLIGGFLRILGDSWGFLGILGDSWGLSRDEFHIVAVGSVYFKGESLRDPLAGFF